MNNYEMFLFFQLTFNKMLEYVTKNREKTVEWLINHGANVTEELSRNISELHYAAKMGNFPTFQLLILFMELLFYIFFLKRPCKCSQLVDRCWCEYQCCG